MNKNTQSLKEIFLSATASYKKKDFKNAEILCFKVLSIDSNHFDTIYLLATLNAIKRDFKKAKELMMKAVTIQPKNKAALNNLGTAYKELGMIKEAMETFKKILKIDENHINANYNIGLSFYSLRELQKAKKYLQKTVNLQDNYAIAYYSLGNVHYELKEMKEAMSCYQKAIEINPKIFNAYNHLGLVYRELNDFQNSINSYLKSIEVNPSNPNAYHNLAEVYKETGNFKKSIECNEITIKHEPNNLMSYYSLCELKKDYLNSELKKKIEKIINDKKTSLHNLAYGYYLLAKYERLGKNYKKEFEYLIKGHKNFYESKKEKFDLGIKYCFDDVLQIEKNINVNKISTKSKISLKPIFIFGVPRCGSTLVEKIIGSGKNYIPSGEEIGVIGGYVISKVLEMESLNLGSSKEISNELFEIYKNRGLVFEKYNYMFTDKSLDNFFYLKLIKEIYPSAKFVHCKRNLLSSIVSIFQNNLTILAWAHNLDNIFKYFDNYLKIVENYSRLNPDSIYNLNFEELINNPEEESKKLMNYCELPWDKKCLEFYKRKDLFSKTASNIQIRKGIYKHSNDKYAPYKKILEKYQKKYSWFN